jgi:ABC-type glycerol-3-phosphate transport system substrate-binding protein
MSSFLKKGSRNYTNKIKKDMAKKVSAEQLNRAVNLIPPMTNQNELNEVINQMVQNALLGEKTATEAIADAEAEWNSILAE